jgi:phosphate transport system substrate-binding protein
MSSTGGLAAAALVLSLIGCTRTEPVGGDGTTLGPGKGAVAVKGSDTMVILAQRWAEEFMKAHPGATVQVTGGGTGTGIAALINGTTDICQASRPMKEKERADLAQKRGAEAVETKVALDAIAVYVNENNPIAEITVPDLAKIYTGKTTSWSELGGSTDKIVVYGRENSSGTYGYFKEHVLENVDFDQTVQTLAGTSAVAAAVKGDPRGIGYGGIAYLEGIKALKVKRDAAAPAVAASLQTAQDGTYPLARSLFFYTAGPARGTAKRFIEFVTGAEGQKVIEEVGYYPLPQ